MQTELLFILVAGGVAALVAIGALVAVVRDRERGNEPSPAGTAPVVAADATIASSYETVVRAIWWVSVVGILVGIGLTNAYPDRRAEIYLVGGAAAITVLILRELLPHDLRGRWTYATEVVAALALASALVWLTDGAARSPFIYAYHLVVVAAALTMGPRMALLVAGAASASYLGQLLLGPSVPTAADLLRVGINLGSLWLLAYLAGVYANGERRARARVLELSQTDPLTGLSNRAQLFPRLEQEVQRTRRSGRGFCVLMVDLDGLKAINDSLGHLRGDDVLRSVGRVVAASIRGVDAAYRFGGDEFTLLLPETEFVGAYVVAEKIREGVEEIATALGSDAAQTSVSIGLVSHPEDGATAEELMIAADRAMYTAKSLGKNQISGNPRPRRTLARALLSPPANGPSSPGATEPEAPEVTTEAPFPVEAAPRNGSPRVAHGDDEPDPADVRRQIAAARRNMDPDHQIRRAMDAFLSSPSIPPAERD